VDYKLTTYICWSSRNLAALITQNPLDLYLYLYGKLGFDLQRLALQPSSKKQFSHRFGIGCTRWGIVLLCHFMTSSTYFDFCRKNSGIWDASDLPKQLCSHCTTAMGRRTAFITLYWILCAPINSHIALHFYTAVYVFEIRETILGFCTCLSEI
jgi:hypothetical protein